MSQSGPVNDPTGSPTGPPPPGPIPCALPLPTTFEEALAEVRRLRELQAEADDLILAYRNALAGEREHPGDEGPRKE